MTDIDNALDEARTQLANYAHEAWSGWMIYLFEKASPHHGGAVVLNKKEVDRWQRQMNTAFSELPANEQASDYAEADRMFAFIEPALDTLQLKLEAANERKRTLSSILTAAQSEGLSFRDERDQLRVELETANNPSWRDREVMLLDMIKDLKLELAADDARLKSFNDDCSILETTIAAYDTQLCSAKQEHGQLRTENTKLKATIIKMREA